MDRSRVSLFALLAGLLSAQAWTASAQSWSLTGNDGIDPAKNFIGTTDKQQPPAPLILKSQGNEGLHINPDGQVIFPRGFNLLSTFDGDGISLLGSSAGPKDVGLKFFDEGGLGVRLAWHQLAMHG